MHFLVEHTLNRSTNNTAGIVTQLGFDLAIHCVPFFNELYRKTYELRYDPL